MSFDAPLTEGHIVGTRDYCATEFRKDVRTNMFVVGTLYTPSGSAPVKIRNLSPGGALVEGGVIPPRTTKISLSRGSLTITGEVVWCDQSRAGLRFDSRASVSDWLPCSNAVRSQQRVDELVQHIKGNLQRLPASPDPPPGQVTANDLASLRKKLDALAEDLAEDAEVVGRHAAKLQILDTASQVLGKLCEGEYLGRK